MSVVASWLMVIGGTVLVIASLWPHRSGSRRVMLLTLVVGIGAVVVGSVTLFTRPMG